MEMTRGISANQEEGLGSADAGWWNALPENLQREVLAWLPADSLTTYRMVCREWNALFSSSEFLSGLWVNKPINRKPWLILLPRSSRERCQAYCFYRGTWEPSFSLSFLPRHDDQVFCPRSAAGRLLVSMGTSLYVCNPYRGTSMKLRPPISKYNYARVLIMIKSGANNNNNNNRLDIYNVVAMGRRSGSNAVSIVEIYDSSVKSWRIAGQIPEDPLTSSTIFCDGYFYCRCLQRGSVEILVFSIEGGGELRICDISPLPDGNDEFEMFPLVACGSRVLLVLALRDSKGFIIWEFRRNLSNSSWFWVEIARMPPDIVEQILPFYEIFCQGIGDCICFMSIDETTAIVCVYYLDSKLWKLLPSCELDMQDDPMPIAFQPRPDLNIT